VAVVATKSTAAKNARKLTGNATKMLVTLLKDTRQRVVARDVSVTATDNRQEVGKWAAISTTQFTTRS